MKNKDLSRFYPNAGKRGNDEFLRKSDGGGGSGSYTETTTFFSGNVTVVDLGGRYGFNLGQIEGLDTSVQTVTLTIANSTKSDTYTLNKVNEDPLVWSDSPDFDSTNVYIMLTDGTAGLYVVAFTESDLGDTYNVTISVDDIEENFKSAVETVLVDNGLISEPETIFDETLTLVDEELQYELPSDFPDGWYENAVCTVNGTEIPKNPEEEYAFTLSTADTIYVNVSYIPSEDVNPAVLNFSYCDVPNDYAIIPGDYQVKIITQIESDSDNTIYIDASSGGVATMSVDPPFCMTQ